MRKNGFLVFMFSFIPGAGQMYQGYMKRGMSIMLLFGASIALVAMTRVPIFSMFIPIIYAYAFFDTFNLRTNAIDNSIEGTSLKEDSYIWNDLMNKDALLEKDNSKTNKYIGIIFLIVGIYILLSNLMSMVTYNSELKWLYNYIKITLQYLPSVIISLISIGVGVKLMLGRRK